MLSSAEFTSGLLVNVFSFHRKSFYSRNSLSHINSYVAVQSTFGALFKKDTYPDLTSNWGWGWENEIVLGQCHQEADTCLKDKAI